MTEYRKLLYEFFKRRRRKRIVLIGTILQRVQQLVNILSDNIITFVQIGNKWVLVARNGEGKRIHIVNNTRIACLLDLATILEYEVD